MGGSSSLKFHLFFNCHRVRRCAAISIMGCLESKDVQQPMPMYAQQQYGQQPGSRQHTSSSHTDLDPQGLCMANSQFTSSHRCMVNLRHMVNLCMVSSLCTASRCMEANPGMAT